MKVTARDWICIGCQLTSHICHAPKPTPALLLPSGALLVGQQSGVFAVGDETRVLAACACDHAAREA